MHANSLNSCMQAPSNWLHSDDVSQIIIFRHLHPTYCIQTGCTQTWYTGRIQILTFRHMRAPSNSISYMQAASNWLHSEYAIQILKSSHLHPKHCIQTGCIQTWYTGRVQTLSSKLVFSDSCIRALASEPLQSDPLHPNPCIQTLAFRFLYGAGLHGADRHLLCVVCFRAALANMIIAGFRLAIEGMVTTPNLGLGL